jgi:hypothetical protein
MGQRFGPKLSGSQQKEKNTVRSLRIAEVLNTKTKGLSQGSSLKKTLLTTQLHVLISANHEKQVSAFLASATLGLWLLIKPPVV